MKLHRNARTCPNSRRLIARRVLEEGWTLTAAAEAAGVSVKTARKWVRRYLREGEAGLCDRSSAPRRRPTQIRPDRIEAIAANEANRRSILPRNSPRREHRQRYQLALPHIKLRALVNLAKRETNDVFAQIGRNIRQRLPHLVALLAVDFVQLR